MGQTNTVSSLEKWTVSTYVKRPATNGREGGLDNGNSIGICKEQAKSACDRREKLCLVSAGGQ